MGGPAKAKKNPDISRWAPVSWHYSAGLTRFSFSCRLAASRRERLPTNVPSRIAGTNRSRRRALGRGRSRAPPVVAGRAGSGA
jgi:hypothetical protein